MEELLKQFFPTSTIRPYIEGHRVEGKDELVILYKPDLQLLAQIKGMNFLALMTEKSQHEAVCMLPCYPEMLKKAILDTYFSKIDRTYIMLTPHLFLYLGERLLWRKSSTEDAMVYLTDKEAELLHYLYLHRGIMVPSEQLIASIWNYSETVTSNTLATHMHRLRRKFGTYASLIQSSGGNYSLQCYL